jgi:hypothetical protein
MKFEQAAKIAGLAVAVALVSLVAYALRAKPTKVEDLENQP